MPQPVHLLRPGRLEECSALPWLSRLRLHWLGSVGMWHSSRRLWGVCFGLHTAPSSLRTAEDGEMGRASRRAHCSLCYRGSLLCSELWSLRPTLSVHLPSPNTPYRENGVHGSLPGTTETISSALKTGEKKDVGFESPLPLTIWIHQRLCSFFVWAMKTHFPGLLTERQCHY